MLRRAGHEDVPFAGRLPGEADLEIAQIAEPAVDQLGAPAAGTVGEVVGFEQGDAQSATGGVQCNAGAGDAATDHEHVELPTRREALQCGGALGRVERGGVVHGATSAAGLR